MIAWVSAGAASLHNSHERGHSWTCRFRFTQVTLFYHRQHELATDLTELNGFPHDIDTSLSSDASVSRRVTRSELYEAIWSEPMKVVARRFGVSDVALAKRCRRMGIPLPGRGYWAKKAAGKKVKSISLPKAIPGETIESFEIGLRQRVSIESATAEPNEGPVWDQKKFEALPQNEIVVQTTLDKPRKEIRHTRASLNRAGRNQRGLLRPTDKACFDIQVTKPSIGRAILIAQALLDAADARSIPFTLSSDDKLRTVFHVQGHAVHVRIDEEVQQKELPPPKPKFPWERVPYFYDRYEYVPTGRLTLRIDEQYLQCSRKSWSDGKTQRVEDCLNAFFVGLVSAAEALRLRHEEAVRREAEWKEAERIRQEQARRQAEEAARVKQLEAATAHWSSAKTISAFVDAVEAEAIKRNAGSTIPAELAEWLAWARAYVQRLDPLSASEIDVDLLKSDPSLYWLMR